MRGGALLGFLFLVAGCGFQPLYGDSARQASTSELGSIRIEPISDRLGQITRNYLLDSLTPRGQPAEARYSLRVQLNEARQRLAFEKDATATRALMRLSANYRLTDLDLGKVVSRGNSRAVAAYNIVTSDYATLSSEQNARKRVALLVAEDIKTKLSVCFSRRENCLKTDSVPEPAPAQ